MLPVMDISCAESDSVHGMLPTVLLNINNTAAISVILQAACVLATLNNPGHLQQSVHRDYLACRRSATRIIYGI